LPAIEIIRRRGDLSANGDAPRSRRRFIMLDVLFLAIGFGFLAVTVLYVVACDRL
jgi:hypothetical protein